MYQGRMDQGAASLSREYAGLFSFHQGGRIGQFEKIYINITRGGCVHFLILIRNSVKNRVILPKLAVSSMENNVGL